MKHARQTISPDSYFSGTTSQDSYFWFQWRHNGAEYGIKLERVTRTLEPVNPGYQKTLGRVLDLMEAKGEAAKKFTIVGVLDGNPETTPTGEIMVEVLFPGCINLALSIPMRGATPDNTAGRMGVKVHCIAKRLSP